MGCCLQPQKDTQPPKQKPKVPVTQVPDTERACLPHNNTQKQKQPSFCKSSNIEFDSSSSVRETKSYWKSKSTALFSQQGQIGGNSILQMTIDHESIIKEGEIGRKKDEDYYTIAEKVAFLRKTGDSLKVNMPDGQSVLHCNQQHIFSVLCISEGKPADCIEEVAPNRLVSAHSSPIKLKLKLRCDACKKQMKMTFCISLVNLSSVGCSNCQKEGRWTIIDIICNYPVWGGGSKIDNHERVEPAPASIRVMGCVSCFKFGGCFKLKCGCMACNECKEQDKIPMGEHCWMCQDRSYIL